MTAKRAPSGKRKASARGRSQTVPVLRNDVAHLTKMFEEHIADSNEFRKETREEIAAINQLLARYKGALGLLTLLGSAAIGVLGFSVPYMIRN